MRQYDSALKYWWNYCTTVQQDPFAAGERTILDCLTKKFKEGASYSSLNTLRSAVALINSVNNSGSTTMDRFFKGIYKLKPTTPKYHATWDVEIVFKELESWGSLESLDIQNLSLKLAMLLALGSAFRVQTLALIKLSNIKLSNNGVEIRVTELIKTSRPGADQPFAFFPYFNDRPSLCIARTLSRYIEVTQKLRNEIDCLFISVKKPFKAVGTQTISRWLRTVMRRAGIGEEYTGHSTRHASTSKAAAQGLDVSIIKAAAGWSKNSKTFARFYKRPLDQANNFAESVFSTKD